MIIERYRKDYDGEFILLDTTLADGKKTQQREWVANPIEINHKSLRAVVVGSDINRPLFDFTLLENHVGGLKGSLSLQTYGVGPLWETMKFDYLVADQESADKIAITDYSEHTVVYTTASQCIKHPGLFYIVPYQPLLSPLATAVYLAAFDGHQDIFLIGYSSDTPTANANWIDEIDSVITAYSGTTFTFVGVPSMIPTAWRSRRNVRTMKYPQFITHCDV